MRKKWMHQSAAARKKLSCSAYALREAKKRAALHKKAKHSVATAAKKQASSLPDGYGPAQFRTAYSLPRTAPRAQTIAIVSAYDNPKADSDLGVYSTTFSLPACSSANGCFRKVNERGAASPLPRRDALWALEASLDVQVAHAVCPNCNILLVEADSASVPDLLNAVDTAAELGATEISISWVVNEFSAETVLDSHLDHPGIAITAASGDVGYKAQWPAASAHVTAVGGTTLTLNRSNVRTDESAWSLGGSGCSAYEAKPAWQRDNGCSRRTVPDLAVVGDPANGAAVYDSFGYSGQRGWFKIGGTSLGAPLVAAIYALAGNADQVVAGSYPYSHSDSFFDIRTGANGSCSVSYLCTAGIGYDGPTGLGSPNGVSGF